MPPQGSRGSIHAASGSQMNVAVTQFKKEKCVLYLQFSNFRLIPLIGFKAWRHSCHSFSPRFVRGNSEFAVLCFYYNICSLETCMVFFAMRARMPPGRLDHKTVGERHDVGSQTG
jgi:hypothetical protein